MRVHKGAVKIECEKTNHRFVVWDPVKAVETRVRQASRPRPWWAAPIMD